MTEQEFSDDVKRIVDNWEEETLSSKGQFRAWALAESHAWAATVALTILERTGSFSMENDVEKFFELYDGIKDRLNARLATDFTANDEQG